METHKGLLHWQLTAALYLSHVNLIPISVTMYLMNCHLHMELSEAHVGGLCIPALRSLRCRKAPKNTADVQGRCIAAMQGLLQGHQAGDQGSLACRQIRQRLLPGCRQALLPGRLQLSERWQNRHQGSCEPLPVAHRYWKTITSGMALCNPCRHLALTSLRKKGPRGIPGPLKIVCCLSASMLADLS